MRTRWSINIGPTERVARVLIGSLGAGIALVLLATAGTALTVSLEVALLFAGLDHVVTGVLGHCPLYARLGHSPVSLKRRAS